MDSRVLVIEMVGGSVSSVSFDTGKPLDVSVAVIDHDERHVYRIDEANDAGGEEILALVKRSYCDEDIECGAHGYTDEDDAEVNNG